MRLQTWSSLLIVTLMAMTVAADVKAGHRGHQLIGRGQPPSKPLGMRYERRLAGAVKDILGDDDSDDNGDSSSSSSSSSSTSSSSHSSSSSSEKSTSTESTSTKSSDSDDSGSSSAKATPAPDSSKQDDSSSSSSSSSQNENNDDSSTKQRTSSASQSDDSSSGGSGLGGALENLGKGLGDAADNLGSGVGSAVHDLGDSVGDTLGGSGSSSNSKSDESQSDSSDSSSTSSSASTTGSSSSSSTSTETTSSPSTESQSNGGGGLLSGVGSAVGDLLGTNSGSQTDASPASQSSSSSGSSSDSGSTGGLLPALGSLVGSSSSSSSDSSSNSTSSDSASSPSTSSSSSSGLLGAVGSLTGNSQDQSGSLADGVSGALSGVLSGSSSSSDNSTTTNSTSSSSGQDSGSGGLLGAVGGLVGGSGQSGSDSNDGVLNGVGGLLGGSSSSSSGSSSGSSSSGGSSSSSGGLLGGVGGLLTGTGSSGDSGSSSGSGSSSSSGGLLGGLGDVLGGSGSSGSSSGDGSSSSSGSSGGSTGGLLGGLGSVLGGGDSSSSSGSSSGTSDGSSSTSNSGGLLGGLAGVLQGGESSVPSASSGSEGSTSSGTTTGGLTSSPEDAPVVTSPLSSTDGDPTSSLGTDGGVGGSDSGASAANPAVAGIAPTEAFGYANSEKLILPGVHDVSAITGAASSSPDDAVSANSTTADIPLAETIIPVGGATSQPANTTVVAILFKESLKWSFLATTPATVAQIFGYMPGILSEAINEQPSAINTIRLQAYYPTSDHTNQSAALSLYLAYIPQDQAQSLASQVKAYNQSSFYTIPTNVVAKQLVQEVDPTFDILSMSDKVLPNSVLVKKASDSTATLRNALIGVGAAFLACIAAFIGWRMYRRQKKQSRRSGPAGATLGRANTIRSFGGGGAGARSLRETWAPNEYEQEQVLQNQMTETWNHGEGRVSRSGRHGLSSHGHSEMAFTAALPSNYTSSHGHSNPFEDARQNRASLETERTGQGSSLSSRSSHGGRSMRDSTASSGLTEAQRIQQAYIDSHTPSTPLAASEALASTTLFQEQYDQPQQYTSSHMYGPRAADNRRKRQSKGSISASSISRPEMRSNSMLF